MTAETDKLRADLIEREQKEFEAWYRGHIGLRPGQHISTFLHGVYELLIVQSAWEGWKAARARPIEVTEEMAIRGAWGPVNEHLKLCEIDPFHPGSEPSKPEIERARLILIAALKGVE